MMEEFCFGNYAKLLKEATSFSDDDIVNTLFDSIVTSVFLKNKKGELIYQGRKEVSGLLNCRLPIPKAIQKSSGLEEVKSTINNYFEKEIVSKINEYKTARLIESLSELVNCSDVLAETDKNYLLSLANEETLVSFLAVTFLYTLNCPNVFNKKKNVVNNTPNMPDEYDNVKDSNSSDESSHYTDLNSFLKDFIIRRDTKKVVIEYREEYEKNTHNEYELGIAYYYGDGIDKNLKKSEEFLHEAANKGHIDAQSSLGDFYSDDSNPKFNPALAMEWYMKAAERGHSKSQWFLGAGYLMGIGTKIDIDKAKYWLYKSAEQGDADGQYGLAYYYFLIENYEEAKKWLLKAVEQGHKEAIALLKVAPLPGFTTDEK